MHIDHFELKSNTTSEKLQQFPKSGFVLKATNEEKRFRTNSTKDGTVNYEIQRLSIDCIKAFFFWFVCALNRAYFKIYHFLKLYLRSYQCKYQK